MREWIDFHDMSHDANCDATSFIPRGVGGSVGSGGTKGNHKTLSTICIGYIPLLLLLLLLLLLFACVK